MHFLNIGENAMLSVLVHFWNIGDVCNAGQMLAPPVGPTPPPTLNPTPTPLSAQVPGHSTSRAQSLRQKLTQVFLSNDHTG